MGLLTVAELREHVESALPDTALERLLAGCELAIAQWAGPLSFDEDGAVADRGVLAVEQPARGDPKTPARGSHVPMPTAPRAWGSTVPNR